MFLRWMVYVDLPQVVRLATAAGVRPCTEESIKKRYTRGQTVGLVVHADDNQTVLAATMYNVDQKRKAHKVIWLIGDNEVARQMLHDRIKKSAANREHTVQMPRGWKEKAS